MAKIRVEDENKEFTVNDGDILFDSLDKQGHHLPHGCLSGSYGACKIEICSGADNLDYPSPVEANTIKAVQTNLKRIHGPDYLANKTIRLSCRAKVNGDISIKLIK